MLRGSGEDDRGQTWSRWLSLAVERVLMGDMWDGIIDCKVHRLRDGPIQVPQLFFTESGSDQGRRVPRFCSRMYGKCKSIRGGGARSMLTDGSAEGKREADWFQRGGWGVAA